MSFIRNNAKLLIATLIGIVLSLLPRWVWSQDVDVAPSLGAPSDVSPYWIYGFVASGVTLMVLSLSIRYLRSTRKNEIPAKENF